MGGARAQAGPPDRKCPARDSWDRGRFADFPVLGLRLTTKILKAQVYLKFR